MATVSYCYFDALFVVVLMMREQVNKGAKLDRSSLCPPNNDDDEDPGSLKEGRWGQPDLVITPNRGNNSQGGGGGGGGGSADLGRVPEPLTDSFEKRETGFGSIRLQWPINLGRPQQRVQDPDTNSRRFMQEKNLLKLQNLDRRTKTKQASLLNCCQLQLQLQLSFENWFGLLSHRFVSIVIVV
jgi:hypothetical protein